MGLRGAAGWWHRTTEAAWDESSAYTHEEWLRLPLGELVQLRDAKKRRARMHAVRSMGGEVA